jgi:hypothetical protein
MERQIEMSVSGRIFQSCQLDMLAGQYGLTRIKSNGRKGYWFVGLEKSWRKLADDVDYRACGQFDLQSGLYPSEGLHNRINKHAARVAA